MKLSEKWLREWVDPPVTTEVLVRQLTTVGLEVESVEPVAAAPMGIVVAEVLQTVPHPDADRLHLCTVAFGADEPVEVVCGAPNVRAGLRVPYAPVGTRLPGGKKIRAAKIRGIQSHGMLCSPIEIGLGEESDGIMELGEDALTGASLRDYLDLDDVSIDINLTPNRGDCLGVIGVAREVGMINGCKVNVPPIPPVHSTVTDELSIVLEAPAECPRYVGRVIRDIDPAARTPSWMLERLRRSGVRGINPVVDVTNYVMLELGQPMHGFDLKFLEDGIQVRRASAGEALTLLDGQKLSLDAEALVIADGSGAVALAGVMGGLASAVTSSTRDIFLESAFFEPRHVAGDARRYGLHTDASHRFERGVDPEHQRRAVERATGLLLEIVGGDPGPVSEARSDLHLPKREPVRLRRVRIKRLLGIDVDAAVVTETLRRLELGVDVTQDAWEVTPPAFRFDISIEADLIEEVARVVGYDSLPSHRPAGELLVASSSESSTSLSQYRQVLVQRGYHEAITYSFVDSELQARLDPNADFIRLANPISADMGVMRTTLWTGLVQALLYNTKRQQPGVRLFEAGLVFSRVDGSVVQRRTIAGVATGPAEPGQWTTPKRELDFFDVRGDVEALLEQGGAGDEYRIRPTTHPALHPGGAAEIERNGAPVGLIGMLHPHLARELKSAGPIFAFELELAAIERGRLPRFEELSKFPGLRRDIAVVVDETVSAQSVRDCVGQSATDMLKNLELFDVYQGEGIDSGKKSLALSLTFQASSRTLNDAEVDSLVTKVVDSLAAELGAVLRG